MNKGETERRREGERERERENKVMTGSHSCHICLDSNTKMCQKHLHHVATYTHRNTQADTHTDTQTRTHAHTRQEHPASVKHVVAETLILIVRKGLP